MLPKKLLFAALLLAYACTNNDTNTVVQGPQPESSTIPDQATALVDTASQQTTTNSNQGNDSKEEASDYRGDSVSLFFNGRYDIQYYKVGKDTLELVSGSDFLFYPLGRCQDASCLRIKFSNFTFTTEVDTTNERTNLQRGVYKDSFIKLLFDPEKKYMQLVSGKILNPEIVFTNGIALGIQENKLMSLFIKNSSFLKGARPKVIQLTSVVNGINHVYTFEDNMLNSIVFNTDYALNKE